MPVALKKYLFILLLLLVLADAATGRWLLAAACVALLFGWLVWETLDRQRFSFIAQRRCAEAQLSLPGAVRALAVSQAAPWALLVLDEQQIALVDLRAGRRRWLRSFAGQALAVAARPDGRLLWASEDRLHLADADGRDQAELAFEAPLYRQNYRLLLSADGRRAFLQTPWFIQAFDPDLAALGPRLRYEDAGHYLKYAVVSPDGGRLYTAGALLLDEEESGGGAMEARWDAWDLGPGGWTNAWKEAYQSPSNSHLRGLSLSADGGTLCAELWQESYEFRLHRPDGSVLWQRTGERPVLSPDGRWLLWENRLDGVVLSRVADREKAFSLKLDEAPRLKSVAADGSCLLVLSGRILILDGAGRVGWEAPFKASPEDLGLGPQGALLLSHQDRAGRLSLPWRG